MNSGQARSFTDHRSPVTGHCHGFTLVEVVLVTVVLALLLTASVPRFQASARRLRAEQAAFAVTQLLRYAHERAVIQDRPIVWVWDAEARQGRLEAIGDDGQYMQLSESAAQTATMPSDLQVAVTSAEREVDHVTFLPDGTSDPASLTITHGELTYTVTVDATTSQPHLVASSATQ